MHVFISCSVLRFKPHHILLFDREDGVRVKGGEERNSQSTSCSRTKTVQSDVRVTGLETGALRRGAVRCLKVG